MQNSTAEKTNKTTLFEKLGYGSASMGDAISYSFVSVFLSFFLTTVAGLPPAVAGTIAAAGSIWNAVWNPIIGYMADRVRTRFGRRRPLIFGFALPLALATFLLFTKVPFSDGVKPLYYGLMLMLYWTSYTGYFVPYLALGADYTQDYNDRTVLRLISSLFNMIGNAVAMVLPTLFVEALENAGFETGRAWSLAALILGLISAGSILITVFASARKDPPCAVSDGKEGVNAAKEGSKPRVSIFSEYLSVARLKPAASIIITSLSALCCFTLIMSDLSYYFTFKLGFSAAQISAALISRALLAIAFIPIVGRLVLRFDKKLTLILAYTVGAALLIITKLDFLPHIIGIPLFMLAACLCTAIYWQIIPGIFYDIAEYDRITNGRNRAATVVSFQGLVEAFAAGIGGQLLGLILEFGGFDGSAKVQSERALIWIENCATLVPIVFIAITCIAISKYPLTREVYEELLKSEGEAQRSGR